MRSLSVAGQRTKMVFYIRSSIPWPSNNVSCGTGKSNTGIAAVCCDKRSAQMKEEGKGEREGRKVRVRFHHHAANLCCDASPAFS